MKTLITFAALAALSFAQEAPKPTDLTDTEKLAVMQSVVRLRGYEITRKQMIEGAEKQIREYRDSVLKQLDAALEKLKTEAETEGKALESQVAKKATKGWRLNPDKGVVWEKEETQTAPAEVDLSASPTPAKK
jgi:hypothetical protein